MAIDKKRLNTDPDGNLYRGWAVGVQSGAGQLALTILVMLLQITAPAAILMWAWPTLTDGKLEYFWNRNFTVGENTSDVLIRGYGEFGHVIEKVVGTLFLSLVYINGENILKRSDLQTDELRRLFGRTLRTQWMFIDAFVNSWCVTLCALAAAPILWTSEGVKDMLLDSLGLVFLYSLDDYGGGIEYGIETSDWDDMIDDAEEQRANRRSSEPAGMTSETLLRESQPDWKTSCFWYGDIFYTIGRFVNLVSGCWYVPNFALCDWVESKENITFEPGSIILFGIVLAVVLTLRLCQLGDKDCFAGCIWVLFSRQDPRRIPSSLPPSVQLRRDSSGFTAQSGD